MCVYAPLYARMYVCMYVCVHVCMHVYAYTSAYDTCMHTCTHAFIRIVYTNSRACAPIHTHAHTNIEEGFILIFTLTANVLQASLSASSFGEHDS